MGPVQWRLELPLRCWHGFLGVSIQFPSPHRLRQALPNAAKRLVNQFE